MTNLAKVVPLTEITMEDRLEVLIADYDQRLRDAIEENNTRYAQAVRSVEAYQKQSTDQIVTILEADAELKPLFDAGYALNSKRFDLYCYGKNDSRFGRVNLFDTHSNIEVETIEAAVLFTRTETFKIKNVQLTYSESKQRDELEVINEVSVVVTRPELSRFRDQFLVLQKEATEIKDKLTTLHNKYRDIDRQARQMKAALIKNRISASDHAAILDEFNQSATNLLSLD